MNGWPNHTITMKSRKGIIQIEIALIDKKNSYITRVLTARFQLRGV